MKLRLVAAALLIPWSAQAADLGGNCCADLEERVAELEATVARKGNRKVSLEVSGHVHEAILFHDIDQHPRPSVSMIPGTQSVSRFRFRGETQLNADWSSGFLIEVGLGGFEPGPQGGERNSNLLVRHSALYIKSKTAGTIWLGRSSMATDGVAEIDLSKSGVASTPLSLAPADGALLGVSVDPFDGYRTENVRWISPTVAGFQISASFADNDNFDAALRYAGEFGSIRVAAGIGYREDCGQAVFDVGCDTKTVVGSGSIHEIKSGLFVTGAWGQVDAAISPDKLKGWSLRGGIEKPIAAGVTGTAFGEYGSAELGNFDGDFFGGGLVVSTGPFNFYGTLRKYRSDVIGDDATIGVVGAKIAF